MEQEQCATDKQYKDYAERNSSFVFLGGNLALDLVNTEVPTRGGKTRDVLDTPLDVASWWNHAQEHYPEAAQVTALILYNNEVFENMKCLRSELRHLFTIIVQQQSLKKTDLEGLNRFLQAGYPVVEITAEGRPLPNYHIRDGKYPILLTVALAAFHLITQHDLTRLRACQNSACPLFFYDTTKSATRHWCSVKCKERVRSVIRHKKAKRAEGDF